MDQEKVDGLVFSSNFDSGNLQSAERAKDGAWELTIAKDCEGTEFERRSSTWFYFRVRDDDRAAPTFYLNEARGETPNVEWRVVALGRPALAWVLLRDVAPGEELLVAYDA